MVDEPNPVRYVRRVIEVFFTRLTFQGANFEGWQNLERRVAMLDFFEILRCIPSPMINQNLFSSTIKSNERQRTAISKVTK
jgi:hypothetical protein